MSTKQSSAVNDIPGDPLLHASDDMAELRRLLLGADYDTLLEFQSLLANPLAYQGHLASIISEVIEERTKRDNSLAKALKNTIETAISESIINDPKSLANALYPVMGPAIRKSIIETITSMMASFNTLIDHSLSFKSIGWRIAAWRTGKPFAEIVFLNTLLYHVEQIFLIHRKTGLVLQHVVAANATSKDPDMVSGMLTAIQDFVTDSFDVDESQGIDSLRVADLKIILVHGPYAVFAAVTRGSVPDDLRASFERTLEDIHRSHDAYLKSYDGNGEVFDNLEPTLSACLETQSRISDVDNSDQPAKKIRLPIVLLVLATIAVGGWATFSAWNDHKTEQRWQALLKLLEQEPGIVVVDAHREGNQFNLTGLRDPLAKAPSQFIGLYEPDMQIQASWQHYQSLEAPFVEARFKQHLTVPAGVDLRVDNGLVSASGVAPRQWIEALRNKAATTPGIDSVDMSQLSASEDAEADRIKAIEQRIYQAIDQVNKQRVIFAVSKSTLDQENLLTLDELASSVEDLQALSAAIGKSVVVKASGHSDSSGSVQLNEALRLRRADYVKQQLVLFGVDAESIQIHSDPTLAEEKISNPDEARAVSFFVELIDGKQ